MRFDLHTHHERCGHADGALREYVDVAIERGLDAIGLSAHSPFFGEDADHHKPWVCMAKSEFARYIEEACALRDAYAGRIKVLVGVESDYYPELADPYEAIYAGYPLDYVIGSVHVVGEFDIFNPKRWESATPGFLREELDRYCDLVARSARSGRFEILGHIDALKGGRPEIAEIDTPAIDEMLRAIAEADVVVEVNTSGKTKQCGGWYPSPALLGRAHDAGVKITFGSDAHVADRIADDFDEVRDTAKAIGYREWYVFENRQRIAVSL